MCRVLSAVIVLIAVSSNIVVGQDWDDDNQHDVTTTSWSGTWFPQSPDNNVDDNPTVQYNSLTDSAEEKSKQVTSDDEISTQDNQHTTDWPNKWFPQPPGKLFDDNPIIEYNNTLNDTTHTLSVDDLNTFKNANDQSGNEFTSETSVGNNDVTATDDDYFNNGYQRPTTPWAGKWFPQPPSKPVDDNPLAHYNNTESPTKEQLHDEHHGIQMGVPSSFCDDAKTNLTIDWDESPVNYTCYEDKKLYLPNEETEPVLTCEQIPAGYSAIHYCMEGPIHYNKIIPTFGGHRPLWPKYGEYRYLPIQRWLHSLEHGAIVMLYHPCANAEEVDKLRKLVVGCLWRHIITPYNLLSKDKPLVLVAWGCRLEMSKIDPNIVLKFIQKASLRGPERIRHNGQFGYGLIQKAAIVSDKYDSHVCPNATTVSQMK